MPIRINLLAEQQALEEMRRKDPVKRSVWIAGFIVSLMLIWSLSVQLQIWRVRQEMNGVQLILTGVETNSFGVVTNKVKTEEMDKKLLALQRLSTNRFLCASVLNAIQFALPDNVQMTRIRTKQDFEESPAIPMKKDGDRIIQPFKPATTTEKAHLFIDGTISGPTPDASLDIFRLSLRNDSYLKLPFASDNSLRLGSRTTTPDLNDAAKTIMNFTLEGVFPEKTRQ